MKRRIGIFRGTFDPIHKGHISFALQAVEQASLDRVYFLVETNPTHKINVTSILDRRKMVSLAIKPYSELHLLELDNVTNGGSQIVPKLRTYFRSALLVFLMGSDVAKTLPHWPDRAITCEGNEIVIGLRRLDDRAEIVDIFDGLDTRPVYSMIISAPIPDASSSNIRVGFDKNTANVNIDAKIAEYIKTKQLY